MSLPGRFLDTTVARRILGLFLVAALLPLAVVGYRVLGPLSGT